ncbi:polyprenyl synthetase family protein [Nocardiopsis sp. CT-R113]|uniref:Polyprenyl synthetase family protein n=1 Tax=Nocardiopsis codii TaxID=3065942 RepID=A0ABU7KIF8_9ACTN|nr:polyprenyl synthetase family protein [Nocardiopsis sp. CT-R113]MEE2041367.1 polyprenyl synthetase family protein [Nocardiopsis sp. CT-R113]
MAETQEQILLRARVDAALQVFARQEANRLIAIDVDLLPVAEQLLAAVNGGKRLRAAFCYWGWRAAGQPDSDALVRAAAAMELLHAAAVIHDDLIDESAMRHGLPSAHVALSAALTGRARPRAGGRSLAMLTGDLLMSWAAQLFVSCGLPSAYLSRARDLWAVMARELIAGECLEVLRTGSAPDTARSLQVVRYKTAKYTVEHPLRIGGALAGAPAPLMEAFTAYGLPLGEAFQLRDDLLGLFGDPEVTGKSNLDDIRGNRPTALFSETWSAATAAERRELRGLVGRHGLDGEGLSRVRSITLRTGAPGRVEEMIAQRVEAATDALVRADLPDEATAALSLMVAAAAARQS